jgi:cobalamin biosynthesis Mg chelatase CobN
MRIHRVLYICFLISFIASPALAQSPFKGGMNYVVVNKSQRTLASIEPSAGYTTQSNTQTQATNQDNYEQRIWNKYRNLTQKNNEAAPAAETQAAKPQTQASQSHTLKMAKASSEQTTSTAAATSAPAAKASPRVQRKANGIGALLEQYEQRKAARGQMRSLNVTN